jgi:hypothetical protein
MGGALLNKWTVIVILAALLSIFTACRREVKPLQVKPDADGKLTYHGPGYRFRVWPNQAAQNVWIEDALERGPVVIMLSIDRREFGAPEAPAAPTITCKADGSCSDSCADGRGCEDLANGWYRVTVLPVAETWGVDPHKLNLGPQMGTGFSCADSKRPGLEVCWDPARIDGLRRGRRPNAPRFRDDTLFSESNARPVWYPAIKDAAAYVWVSTAASASNCFQPASEHLLIVVCIAGCAPRRNSALLNSGRSGTRFRTRLMKEIAAPHASAKSVRRTFCLDGPETALNGPAMNLQETSANGSRIRRRVTLPKTANPAASPPVSPPATCRHPSAR